MNYLLCLIDGNQDYTEISEEQEHKINDLIESHRIPQEFTLNKKLIQSSTILGFTHKKVVHSSSEGTKFKNWDEFRDWAHKQSWYKKHAISSPESDTTLGSETLQQSLVA